jgi:hypothetical protein
MHLVPNSQLYGLSARVVRDFLRRFAFQVFDEECLRDHLKIDDATAKTVVAALLSDALIEFEWQGSVNPTYRTAPKGRQLAAAKFAPQISRAAGERLLAAVIARAQDTVAQRPFVFRVSKIALFGSMLGDAPLVSDVDIGLEVETPFDGEQYAENCRTRIESAERSGKRFRTMIESVAWPRTELIQYLRGGERYVSIHSFHELLLLRCPYRLAFDRTAEAHARGSSSSSFTE